MVTLFVVIAFLVCATKGMQVKDYAFTCKREWCLRVVSNDPGHNKQNFTGW